MSDLNQRSTIKESFDSLSSFPRKYTIISVLITYIIITVLEYYIQSTAPPPPLGKKPNKKKKLTKRDLILDALFVFKNITLVVLILCILPLIDPIPIIHNILFEKTLDTKKYIHIMDILDKYTVNPNRLKQVTEDLQEHIDKVDNLILFDSNNTQTNIDIIIRNLNEEITNNWKKVQNKYWFPMNDNISKFREFIKRSDALELIDRKFYVESGIFQSDTTYTIKVLEKLAINMDLINYFFTTDLIYNLNNSSIKDIFGCLIEYYYDTKRLVKSDNEDTLERFLGTIKGLCINKTLKESTKDILKIFSSSGTLKELDTSLDDHMLNYYSDFTKDIYLDGNKKLDADFIKTFNSKGNIKLDIAVLVETLYNSMVKKYPYLIKHHVNITNEAFNIYKTPNVSKLNIKSNIDFSKFKDLHFTKSKQYINDFIFDDELDIENSKSLNKIKNTYSTVNKSNIDYLFNWFKEKISVNNEKEYYNYLHILYSSQLNDTHLKSTIIEQQKVITNSLNLITDYIINDIPNSQYPLIIEFPSKIMLDDGSNISGIIGDFKKVMTEKLGASNIATKDPEGYMQELDDILAELDNNKLHRWIKSDLELKTAQLVYKFKLGLLDKNEWDYFENPAPYKRYEEMSTFVNQFSSKIEKLITEKEAAELDSDNEEPFVSSLTLKDMRDAEKKFQEMQGYIINPQLIDNTKKEYEELAKNLKVTQELAKEKNLYDIEAAEIQEKMEKKAEKIKLKKLKEIEEAAAEETAEAAKKATEEAQAPAEEAAAQVEEAPAPAEEAPAEEAPAEEAPAEEAPAEEASAEEASAPVDPPPPTKVKESDADKTKRQFGGAPYDVESLKIDCKKGMRQIDSILTMRSNIIKGINYNIREFNDAFFNTTSHPVAILNINMSNVFCIIFNIVYLILIIKSKNNYHSYHKFVIYSFYAVSMLYVLNTDKTLNHIMNNIQLCKFVPYLIIFRTILYLYSTFYDNYQKTAYDVSYDTVFELDISKSINKNNVITFNEKTNKRTFTAVKLLASSADLITVILLIFLLLNYLKPVILSTKSNDVIEIFDFDMINNNIRQKVDLNFSITDNFEWNKTIFNTHPISEKILILFDNMNINDDNKLYFIVNMVWKIIGFSLIMQLYYKIKAEYVPFLSGNILEVRDNNVALNKELNKKEDLTKYLNFKEFYDIFVAYVIIIFLMFGPNYMTIISKISLYLINSGNTPTTVLYESGRVFWNLVVRQRPSALRQARVLLIGLGNCILGAGLLVACYYILGGEDGTLDRIFRRVTERVSEVTPIFKGETIGGFVFLELISLISLGVACQVTYITIFNGSNVSLYYNYDTLDIINNFNKVINMNSAELFGGSGNILNNYKNIFIIIILCLIIFMLNKIKKDPKNIMDKKKDKLQKGGNEFFTTFIFKHLFGVKGLESKADDDHIREIGISIVLFIIVGILMKLGISTNVLNQLETEIFYDNNYILLLIIIIIPTIRYIYNLYTIWKKNNVKIDGVEPFSINDYIIYHFSSDYPNVVNENDDNLNIEDQTKLHNSKLEIKVHTLLAVIVGIFLSLALNLTHHAGHTIIVSIAIVLFIVFSNFGCFIFWNAFIKDSTDLFTYRRQGKNMIIRKRPQNIEEDGKIVSSNNDRTKEDIIIINKMKTDIIKDIERMKASFNIKENITIGLDDILNKWNYERYTHKTSGKYIDIVDLRKNLEKLNRYEKLNEKQTDEKTIINRHEVYKNLYDGVWEKNTTNEKKNIVERILIKTYGSKHALAISFNSAGYIIKKYNLRIDVLNEATDGKNNIKLYDEDNVNFVLTTQDINDVKYLNYEKYNSSYKKLIDMGSDIKNIETFLSSGNDFFKKINYILDPVKDVSYIIKYKLLEDFNEYRKIENNVNKKCLSSLLIQRIYKKILLIKCITEEKYKEAEQLQNDLDTIELKYNDLSLLSINRNDISLVTHKVQDNINKITINMTNLIGNVLRFKDLESQEVINHDHMHVKGDKHQHTVKFFTNQKTELETAKQQATDEGNTEIVDKLTKQINIVTKNLEDARAMVPEEITKKYTGSTEELNKDHTHEHIHINNGPEQTQDAPDKCTDLNADTVPNSIHGIMEGNQLIKTYKRVGNYHELILKDIITSNELSGLENSLKTLKKYTDFHTGHLEFNLEYTVDKEVKSKPYKINLLGKDAEINLDTPLSLKSKSYLKNIKVEGYYFDADADNICKTTLVIKNNIKSLIVDTYDMTDEFCI